ncbi:MAG: hypothetical protein U0894_05270 [Pirellulales bacterium]
MTDSEFHRQIEHAQKVVASWPGWKRNLLSHSLSPMNSTPRIPVNNSSSQGASDRQASSGVPKE